jgi:hypothetical protein
MLTRAITTCILSLLYVLAIAQPAFYASVSEEKVYLGSYFKLEFQLSNARGSSFKPPSLKGFRLVSGPSRSFQQTIVNGKADAFESYTYTLLAEKIGNFTLQPATIKVNGKTYKSNPVSIKVLEPLKTEDLRGEGIGDGESVFVLAELSVDTAYPGQQVLLDYKLYTKIAIDRYEFRVSPEFKDFYNQEINLLKRSTQKVDIAGNIYNAQLLRRVALFPQRSGQFTIDPAHILLMVPQGRNQRRSFFFNNYETKFVQTTPLKIEVVPLPEPQPAGFSGLVGNYTMECRPGKRRITTDDVLSYEMIIRGDGDPNLLRIPQQIVSKELETYDPTISKKNTDQHQLRLNHYAILEYLYVASKVGRYDVVPEFIFFNPDSNNYIRSNSDTLTYLVSKGQGLTNVVANPDRMSSYELIEKPPSNTKRFKLFNTSLYWLIITLLICGAFVFILKAWWTNRFSTPPPPKTQKEITIEQLIALKSKPNLESHRIEEILGDFLRNKFDIEESSWSLQNLSDQMKKHQSDQGLIDKLTDLFNRCSYAAYSGMNTAMSHSIIDEAVDVLDQL